MLIAINQSEGTGQGSGRTFANFDLHSGLTACESHLIKFGGHRAAAGLKIAVEHIEAFRAAFSQHVGQNHDVQESDLELRIDAEVRLTDLTLNAVKELDRLGPFGRDNPRPVFATQGVQLAEPPRKMGEGERHLSLTVRQGTRKIRAISFGHGDWADEISAAVADGSTISICFAPNINRFRGQENVEMQLIDWKVDGARAAKPAEQREPSRAR